MLGPFSYDLVLHPGGDKYERETGIGMCVDWADAMSRLVNYYGEEEIIEVKSIVLYDATDLLIVPQHVIDNYANDTYFNEAHYPCDPKGERIFREDEENVPGTRCD